MPNSIALIMQNLTTTAPVLPIINSLPTVMPIAEAPVDILQAHLANCFSDAPALLNNFANTVKNSPRLKQALQSMPIDEPILFMLRFSKWGREDKSASATLERVKTFENIPAAKISWKSEDSAYKSALFITEKEVIYIPAPASEDQEDIDYYHGMHVLYGSMPYQSLRAKLPSNIIRRIAEIPEVVRLLSSSDNYEYNPHRGTFILKVVMTDQANIYHGFITEKSLCSFDPSSLAIKAIRLSGEFEHAEIARDIVYIKTEKNLQHIHEMQCAMISFENAAKAFMGYLHSRFQNIALFSPSFGLETKNPTPSESKPMGRSRYAVK